MSNIIIQAFSCSYLVYKFKKNIGNPNFSYLFKRKVNRFKRAGYSLDFMRQTACLVFYPIMVEGYAALFSCTAVVQADGFDVKLEIVCGSMMIVFGWTLRGLTNGFL